MPLQTWPTSSTTNPPLLLFLSWLLSLLTIPSLLSLSSLLSYPPFLLFPYHPFTWPSFSSFSLSSLYHTLPFLLFPSCWLFLLSICRSLKLQGLQGPAQSTTRYQECFVSSCKSSGVAQKRMQSYNNSSFKDWLYKHFIGIVYSYVWRSSWHFFGLH